MNSSNLRRPNRIWFWENVEMFVEMFIRHFSGGVQRREKNENKMHAIYKIQT